MARSISVSLKVSHLKKNGHLDLSCECPSPDVQFLQPSVNSHYKLLAVCESCGAWSVVITAGPEALVVRLPETKELWDAGTEN
jgi:hypothetical protein